MESFFKDLLPASSSYRRVEILNNWEADDDEDEVGDRRLHFLGKSLSIESCTAFLLTKPRKAPFEMRLKINPLDGFDIAHHARCF